MYMYIYTHTYIHTYTYIHVYTYIFSPVMNICRSLHKRVRPRFHGAPFLGVLQTLEQSPGYSGLQKTESPLLFSWLPVRFIYIWREREREREAVVQLIKQQLTMNIKPKNPVVAWSTRLDVSADLLYLPESRRSRRR